MAHRVYSTSLHLNYIKHFGMVYCIMNKIRLKLVGNGHGSSRTREVTDYVYPVLMENLKTQMASTSPTPNLFLTNAPASEVEKSLIRQRVQEARHECRATEASLMSTSTEPTEEIRNRLKSLDDFIHDHEALLSSIRDLPPELLGDIFLWTTWWVRKFETDLDGEILEPNPEFILSLSQVCRYWRTIAIATPGMWASIPTLRKWRSDDPESEAFIYLLRTFIERSGNSPIHITVHITELFNNLEDSDQLQSPCLQLLASQCHRWKTAILHVDKSIIQRLRELYTPDLESLNFRCRYAAAWMDVDAYYPRLHILAPRLTHVIIDSWQSHSFLRLARFDIRTFTGLPNHLDVLLRAGPTLEVCSFRGPVSMMRYPTEPIHFAKMHFLSIINNNYQRPWVNFGHHTETPFRWMNAPNLTFLEIRGHPVHPGASLIVSDLLSNTLSPSSLLRSFTFHVRGLSEDEFTRLLSAMPLLIMLDICDTPSHYFSALVRRKPDDPQKPLVPRLMSIRIQDFSGRDAKPLIELCDSCEPKKSGYQDDLCIDLFYSSSKLCLQAQDRIEGWDSETWIKQRVPGSELSKIFGWAAFIANHFLARDGQSEKYGVGPLSALSASLKTLFILVPSESKTPFSGTFTVARRKR